MRDADDGKIPSGLLSIVKGLWERLQEKAEQQTSEYQRECEAQVLQVQKQLNQYKQLHDDLKSKIHALNEQQHQQTEDNKRLNATLNIEQQEKAKIVERTASLESHNQEYKLEKEHQSSIEQKQKLEEQCDVLNITYDKYIFRV